MSSVTFSTVVGGDGSTVTDDNNATTGLREGGWKTRFVPCFTQQVAVANYIVTKAGEASTSASAASSSATAAAASYDLFDDRYLGSKTSDPSVDNDGNALITGAIYWNSSSNVMKVWSGSAWVSYNPAISYLPLSGGTMTGAITFNAGQTFAGTLPLTGGTMTGAITFAAGQNISGYLPSAGGTMTGNIVFASGQTVANLAAGSAGTIPYQSASGTTAMLAAGTSGQVLQSNGASAPSWVSVASGLSAATQAEMEAATSNTVAATPLNTKWHPGVVKMWLKANISGGINASYNVASITDAGVGKLDITYTTSFSSANYALSYAIQGGSGLSLWFEQGNVTASGCSAYASTFAGSYADPGTAYFISAFGDQ